MQTVAGWQHQHTQAPPCCLHATPASKQHRRPHLARAAGGPQQSTEKKPQAQQKRLFSLDELLGPIGLSLQSLRPKKEQPEQAPLSREAQEASTSGPQHTDGAHKEKSIHSLSTNEWRARYETEAGVDLWVEEEFNSGSRLKGGRDAHKGSLPGFGSGEGRSAGTAAQHAVTIHNPQGAQTVHVDVPEDRYILWEAEERGLLLPYACRMGCCTACAVKVKSGEMHQPQSLGVSREMQEAGYGLMCVGYAKSDLELELVEEDELYDQQFGQYFAQFATDPNNRASIARDDFALELADMDE